MKIKIIEKIDSNGNIVESFLVKNRNRFCKENDLTYRLLSYTATGERNHHKFFRLKKGEFEFIADEEQGVLKLWDTGEIGYKVEVCNREKDKNDVVVGLLDENENLKKQVQKLQDKLTTFRRDRRIDNRFKNYIDDLKTQFSVELKKCLPLKRNVVSIQGESVGMLHWSDWHISQKVETLTNTYDSNIADARLAKYISEAMNTFDKNGVKTVYICMLGDFIHAQSITTKPDMKLSSEFPEVQGATKCYKLMAKYIDMLMLKYNIKIVGVVGNESRFANHINPSNLIKEARNNMDVIIFEFLKVRYSGCKNVEFINNGEDVHHAFKVFNHNILATHSYDIKHAQLSKSILDLKTRLSKAFGTIDYVIMGHIHDSYISDGFSRNSSLVGANGYSDSLGIVESSASQNISIITKDNIKTFSVKLG